MRRCKPEPAKAADSAAAEGSGARKGARAQEAKAQAQGLPLYALDGIGAVPEGTLVVFKIDHNDKRAGMFYGHLPEYGNGATASACLPHAHLASTRKLLKKEMQRCLRGLNQSNFTIAASVTLVEERSARGVEELDLDDGSGAPANLGLRWNVTLDRRQVTKEEEANTVETWRQASRLATIVDSAALVLDVPILALRKRWMYDLYAAFEQQDGEDDEEEDDDLEHFAGTDLRDPVLRLLADLALRQRYALGDEGHATDHQQRRLHRPVEGVLKRNGKAEAAAVQTATLRSLSSFLKPSAVRLEVKLHHPSLHVLRSAFRAAQAVPRPAEATSVAAVEVTVAGPPKYLLSTTAMPHETSAAASYLEEALAAAQSVLLKPPPDPEPDAREVAAGKGADAGAAEGSDGPLPGEDLRLLQPTLNIGLVGHVAHGKSSVCRFLSGKRTQQHSTEHKLHGATVKLGYANCRVHRCSGVCAPPECYTTSTGDRVTGDVPCRQCGGSTHVVRHVSFIDCPGHFDLVTTMLTGAAAFDAALLVVAANEEAPAKQTACHLEVLTRLGLEPDQVLLLQNKAELLFDGSGDRQGAEGQVLGASGGKGAAGRGQAALQRHAAQCRVFTRGTAADGSPLIPVSAHLGHNMDQVARWLAEVPERPAEAARSEPPRFIVIRSFDANATGSRAVDLKGGVVGGALLQGTLKPGDLVEVRPGRRVRQEPAVDGKGGGKRRRKKDAQRKVGAAADDQGMVVEPFLARVQNVKSGNTELPSVAPGGLTGLELDLDPALTRADGLAGMVVGRPGTLPPVFHTLGLAVEWVDPVLLGHEGAAGAQAGEGDESSSSSSSEEEDEEAEVHLAGPGLRKWRSRRRKAAWSPPALEPGTAVRLHVGSSCCTGRVDKVSRSKSQAQGFAKLVVCLSSPVCAAIGSRVAVEVPEDGKVAAAAAATGRMAASGGGGSWRLAGFGTLDRGKECELTGPAAAVPEEEGAAFASPQLPGVTRRRPPKASIGEDGDGDLEEEEQWDDEALRARFTRRVVEENPDLLTRRRVKVPPLEVAKDGGARVVWTNFAAVCAAIDRPPSHLAAFLREEGGIGNVALAGDLSNAKTVQLRVFTRAFRTIRENLGHLLAKYCARYVCCRQCRSARTTLTRNDDCNMLRRTSTSMILTCRDCLACSYPKAL